jgi:long-subunit fatty acid transport protein
MKTTVSAVIIICLMMITVQGKAQHSDFWQWNTISIEKKFGERVGVGLDEEIRLYDNATRLYLTFTNVGATYKFAKWFKMGLNYRFTQKTRDDMPVSYRHRVLVDAMFKYSPKPLTFQYRARYQSQIRDYFTSSDGTVPEQYLRHKVDIKLDMGRRLTPFIAAEFRYQFNNNRLMEANNAFDRGRYYAGVDYELNKNSSFGAYYMIQKEFNINDPETDYVLGLSYTLSLDGLGRKNEPTDVPGSK